MRYTKRSIIRSLTAAMAAMLLTLACLPPDRALASNVGPSLTLGIQTVECLIQTFFVAFAGVHYASFFLLLHKLYSEKSFTVPVGSCYFFRYGREGTVCVAAIDKSTGFADRDFVVMPFVLPDEPCPGQKCFQCFT